MTNDSLGCGHCGRPAELCDCGVDYELAYRPQAEDFRSRYQAQVDSSARGWITLVLGLGAVMALRVIIFGWG